MRSAARLLEAEARKLLGLPATWIGAAIALFCPPLLVLSGALLSGGEPSDYADAGFAELTIGVVGVGLIGAQAIASEYARDRRAEVASRPIVATLAATPRRFAVLAAKLAVMLVACVALAVVTVPITLALSQALVGRPSGDTAELVARAAGVATYWLLSTVLVFAAALILRGGVVPMTILVLNNSVMSISLLVNHLTPLADFLPDLAGMRMYLVTIDWLEVPYGPVGGGLVMAAWSVAAIAAAAAVFRMRDA